MRRSLKNRDVLVLLTALPSEGPVVAFTAGPAGLVVHSLT